MSNLHDAAMPLFYAKAKSTKSKRKYAVVFSRETDLKWFVKMGLGSACTPSQAALLGVKKYADPATGRIMDL